MAATGAAAVLTAPMAIPSNAILAGGFAATQAVSLLFGATGEASRAMQQDEFSRRYEIRKEELKWSMVPTATLFWDLVGGRSVSQSVRQTR